MGLTKNNTIVTIFVVATVAVTTVALNARKTDQSIEMPSAQYNKKVVAEKNDAIKDLLANGKYKCCTQEPCFRCFSKPGNQDKELVCDCLVDIMNGEHPCGECIGEILEGEGNPLIAEYFATAIAEKLGEQHFETLEQIIVEKYDMPPEKQI